MTLLVCKDPTEEPDSISVEDYNKMSYLLDRLEDATLKVNKPLKLTGTCDLLDESNGSETDPSRGTLRELKNVMTYKELSTLVDLLSQLSGCELCIRNTIKLVSD